MRIHRLELHNFRNFNELTVELGGEPLLISGKNGQGKTNILESVFFLSNANSFRAEDRDLINFSAKNFLLRVALENSDEKNTLSSFVDHNRRKILKINHKKSTQHDFVGKLLTTVFIPEDVFLVVDEPAKRRKFLDRLCSLLNRDYRLHLANYKRILNQRNHVLFKLREGLADLGELEIWNAQLISEGFEIIIRRLEMTALVNSRINELYRDITGANATLFLNYLPSLSIDEDIKSNFYKALFSSQEKDLKDSTTSVGPHRDDFEFVLNGRSAARITSRGEHRAMILSLKLAEVELITKVSGTKPILLLDDVFSEFDEDKKIYLGAAIKDYQTIITSATPVDLLPKGLRKMANLELKEETEQVMP